jgi:hypothetical protein
VSGCVLSRDVAAEFSLPVAEVDGLFGCFAVPRVGPGWDRDAATSAVSWMVSAQRAALLEERQAELASRPRLRDGGVRTREPYHEKGLRRLNALARTYAPRGR